MHLQTVHQRLQRLLNDVFWTGCCRCPVFREAALGEFLEMEAPTPEELALVREQRSRVRPHFAKLSGREREIISFCDMESAPIGSTHSRRSVAAFPSAVSVSGSWRSGR